MIKEYILLEKSSQALVNHKEDSTSSDNDNESINYFPINPNINILDTYSINRLTNRMWRQTPYTTTPNFFFNMLNTKKK